MPPPCRQHFLLIPRLFLCFHPAKLCRGELRHFIVLSMCVVDIWRLPLIHYRSLSDDPRHTTETNALFAAFCAASLFFAVFLMVSYISECLRLFIVSELMVTPAPLAWPCEILKFARRFTPLVVIWTCCVDVEGVTGGGVPSTPAGEVASARAGTLLGFPPNLRFQRSKHSQGVRLSIETVTRAELKKSATRVQLEGYFSTKDLRRASSGGLHAWSSRFLQSFGGCGETIPPIPCGLMPSKSPSNKRNQ